MNNEKMMNYIGYAKKLMVIAVLLLVFRALLSVFTQPSNQDKSRYQTAHTQPPSDGCGKICSIEYDSKENGKYYAQLRKNVECKTIIQRLIKPPFTKLRHPPRRPPADMLQDFTQNGQCPLSKTPWYFDNSLSSGSMFVKASQFRKWLAKDNYSNINHYQDDNKLKPALNKYNFAIRGKRVAVIGTLDPWAEAIMINMGAEKVTTLEYRELVIEHKKVETMTPMEYGAKLLADNVQPFDTAFSYSSIEHSGLGRYGDPLMPYGDFEAVAQVWCLTKPNGYFFLAVPVSDNPEACIVHWNAHRSFGYVRLQHLTANWKVLEEVPMGDRRGHRLYVLQRLQ